MNAAMQEYLIILYRFVYIIDFWFKQISVETYQA